MRVKLEKLSSTAPSSNDLVKVTKSERAVHSPTPAAIYIPHRIPMLTVLIG